MTAAPDGKAHDEPIRVLIVEDHFALRQGIEQLLRREGCEIAGVADQAAEGLRLYMARRPHVVVVDIGLRDSSNGLDLSRSILEQDPGAGLLLYTGLGDETVLDEALDCGARGFALKSGSPAEFIAAVHEVANGGTYVDSGIASLLMHRSHTERLGVLSPREREVLALLAEGLTGEDTAARLSLSPETVRTHVRNAMNKLEAKTRVHALAIALRRKEIEI